MIEAALRLVASELDQSLRRRAFAGEGLVVLSNLTDFGGAAVPDTAGKVAAFLVNIEREVFPTRTLRTVDAGRDRLGLVQPPVHLNLFVMFAANFSGSTYNEALKLIGATIAFFQSRPVFTPANSPGMDPGIDQLSLEIENLNTTDLSNIWGILGGRYVPSVLYRMRMITIDSGALETQPPRVVRADANLQPAGGT
jgi:hypothetical protein